MRIVNPMEFLPQLEQLWHTGMPPGDKPGWPEVDSLYSVVPGQMTILTGWPGSGKSEWLDAVILNLAAQGWKFCIYSPENLPHIFHIQKWLEKLLCMPFPKGPTARMTLDEVREGMDTIRQHFNFIIPHQEELMTVAKVIECARIYFENDVSWFDPASKRGLVIDPWNELAHDRMPHISETEYISQQLGQLRAWGRQSNVHIWVVAHPQKLRRNDEGSLPVPTPDSISGSIHWWNKADCAITVHRELSEAKKQEVEIHVQKIRFKHVGRPGKALLLYDRVTGRYNPALRPVDFDPSKR